MGFEQWLAVAIFVVAMVIIMSEKIHRSIVAICGAMLVIILGLVEFLDPEGAESAAGAVQIDSIIDLNTLGVLFGMMLFVAVVKQSGIFEFLAIKCARIAQGRAWRVMMMFIILTAVLSAFLDNVTTVLLIGPMTLTICKLMKQNPIPFFLTQILASNIGGTATLIGDPPNIMIGSAANLSFADFIMVDGPCVVVILIVSIIMFYFMYGRKMEVHEDDRAKIRTMDASKEIKSKYLMTLSVIMIAAVVVFFMLHDALGLKSSIIAMSAAGVMLLLSRCSVEKALLDVEWTTLTFFGGLFVIVGALKQTGVIAMLAQALVDVTGGDVFVLMLVLLVGSAVISAFLDNIPFCATMLPIIAAMQGQLDVTPLWWAVSLGACLGGNGTLIGASANVVLSDIAKKNGYPITFMQFTKVGFPMMLVTVAIAAGYMILRFYTIGF